MFVAQGRGRGSVYLLRLSQVVGRRYPAHGWRQWVYTQKIHLCVNTTAPAVPFVAQPTRDSSEAER
jgi:hypothetical protein